MPVIAAEAWKKVYNARNSLSREMLLQTPGIGHAPQYKPKTILHILGGIVPTLFMAL